MGTNSVSCDPTSLCTYILLPPLGHSSINHAFVSRCAPVGWNGVANPPSHRAPSSPAPNTPREANALVTKQPPWVRHSQGIASTHTTSLNPPQSSKPSSGSSALACDDAWKPRQPSAPGTSATQHDNPPHPPPSRLREHVITPDSRGCRGRFPLARSAVAAASATLVAGGSATSYPTAPLSLSTASCSPRSLGTTNPPYAALREAPNHHHHHHHHKRLRPTAPAAAASARRALQ